MKKKHRNDRPVRDWFQMSIALVLFITAIVNAVFNYRPRYVSEMGAPLRAQAWAMGL